MGTSVLTRYMEYSDRYFDHVMDQRKLDISLVVNSFINFIYCKNC
jgi:hypothetical protein